jgi:hypothetical protein
MSKGKDDKKTKKTFLFDFTWLVLIDLLTHVFQLLIVEFHRITKI